MKMICPSCTGLGVVLVTSNLSVPSKNVEELIKNAQKVLCPTCNGDGEVETGFLAKRLGLKK